LVDGDLYSDEERPVSSSGFMPLRRVTSYRRRYKELPPPPVLQVPWTYRGPLQEEQENKRYGGHIDKHRMIEAIQDLDRHLIGYEIPALSVVEIDSPTGPRAVVELPPVRPVGVVESPGGTEICTLPAVICDKLNQGMTLNPEDMMELLVAVKLDPRRFAISRLFDSLAGPWESVLLSLLRDDVVKKLALHGTHAEAYELVNNLQMRFAFELTSILSNSNVFKKTHWGLFRSPPSVDRMMRAIKKGSYNSVAQTDGFLNRVMQVKEWLDRVLIFAEKYNIYLPTYITAAQRNLPIRGVNVLGVLGDDVVPVSSHIRNKLSGGSSQIVSARRPNQDDW